MRYLYPLVLVALLGGCSSDKQTISTEDGKVTVDQSADSMTIKSTSEGKTQTVQIDEAAGETKLSSSDGTTMVSGTKVPENFPLSIPAGADVQSSIHSSDAESGEQVYVVQFTTSRSQADAAADYEKQLKEKGLTVERVEQSGDGEPMVMLSGESETDQAAVHIGMQEGKTTVMINWTKQKKS